MMLGAISAAGNSVPPFIVLPRVHFKYSMLHGAPPGTVGAAHQTGWMTTKNFVFMQHFIKSNVQRSVLFCLYWTTMTPISRLKPLILLRSMVWLY